MYLYFISYIIVTYHNIDTHLYSLSPLFENLNVFFTDINKAQKKVLELNSLYFQDTEESFKIRVLKEGSFFDADMTF